MILLIRTFLINRSWTSGDSKSIITQEFRTDQRCYYNYSEKALGQQLPLCCLVLCQVTADLQSVSCYRKKNVKKPNSFDVNTAGYPPLEG